MRHATLSWLRAIGIACVAAAWAGCESADEPAPDAPAARDDGAGRGASGDGAQRSDAATPRDDDDRRGDAGGSDGGLGGGGAAAERDAGDRSGDDDAGDGGGGSASGSGGAGGHSEHHDGGTDDAADAAADGDAGDAGGTVAINGCDVFVDRSLPAATRTLTWDESIAADPARCIRIQVGQSVCWSGDFEEHPLEPHGGDTPSPITGAACATFDAVGNYGFLCAFHSEMTGVVQVVP
jgi:hypothetical protein